MAEYSKLYITNNGQALMAKMIAGSGNIVLQKYVLPVPSTLKVSYRH